MAVRAGVVAADEKSLDLIADALAAVGYVVEHRAVIEGDAKVGQQLSAWIEDSSIELVLGIATAAARSALAPLITKRLLGISDLRGVEGGRCKSTLVVLVPGGPLLETSLAKVITRLENELSSSPEPIPTPTVSIPSIPARRDSGPRSSPRIQTPPVVQIAPARREPGVVAAIPPVPPRAPSAPRPPVPTSARNAPPPATVNRIPATPPPVPRTSTSQALPRIAVEARTAPSRPPPPPPPLPPPLAATRASDAASVAVSNAKAATDTKDAAIDAKAAIDASVANDGGELDTIVASSPNALGELDDSLVTSVALDMRDAIATNAARTDEAESADDARDVLPRLAEVAVLQTVGDTREPPPPPPPPSAGPPPAMSLLHTTSGASTSAEAPRTKPASELLFAGMTTTASEPTPLLVPAPATPAARRRVLLIGAGIAGAGLLALVAFMATTPSSKTPGNARLAEPSARPSEPAAAARGPREDETPTPTEQGGTAANDAAADPAGSGDGSAGEIEFDVDDVPVAPTKPAGPTTPGGARPTGPTAATKPAGVTAAATSATATTPTAARRPAGTTKPGPTSTTATAEAVSADGCDKVSCVIDAYARPCCAPFRPRTKSELPYELDRAMITSGMGKAKAAVIRCGEQHPAQGIVRLAMKISAAGIVEDANVSAAPSPALGECVANAVRKLTFTSTETGGTFAYPFKF